MAAARILSTKKLKPNQKQFLLNAGFSVLEADFISVQPKQFTFSDIKSNLIFTSQNAVKAVSDHPDVQEIRRNPVFCVGQKTADLLDDLGFTVLASADYGSELAKIIVSEYQNEAFTFFCGNIRRDELPTELRNMGVDFNEVEVYQTVLAPVKIESDVDGVLFFSPSAVEGFLTGNSLAGKTGFCIGHTTADYLQQATGSNPHEIVTANQPTIESTIAKCISYFNRK